MSLCNDDNRYNAAGIVGTGTIRRETLYVFRRLGFVQNSMPGYYVWFQMFKSRGFHPH